MKKVKFVRVCAGLSGFGFGKGLRSSFEGAEEIIKERIENGWSFEGFVPIETRGTGELETISLIFSKEE